MRHFKVEEVITNTYLVSALSNHEAVRQVIQNFAPDPIDTTIKVKEAIELREVEDQFGEAPTE